MAPTAKSKTSPEKTSKESSSKAKAKEKVFHPQSRKASQLERANLRKSKMGKISSSKSKKQIEKSDRHVFFYHALPPDVISLTLSDIHSIIKEAWLPRHDEALQSLTLSRRPGRPPSTKELQLSEVKLREAEEYRTGLEIPDLTHPPTVTLLRKWGSNADPNFLPLLRFIRISGDNPESSAVSHYGVQEDRFAVEDETQMTVDDEDANPPIPLNLNLGISLQTPIVVEPISRFASTMQTMDAV